MIEKQSHVAVASSKIDAGRSIDAYTLVAGPYRMRVLTLGGIITHFFAPGRDGQAGDVVLGFDDIAKYQAPGPYFGALIGRVGNRTAFGRFTLDSVSYNVTVNDGPHHLHGGKVGYDKRVWAAEADGSAEAPSLRLTLHDPNGHEGYPGDVTVVATYTLSPDGTLRIEYEAFTKGDGTPINPTNHTYFNLKDAGASTVLEHALRLDASGYTPVDATLMPTGEIAPVVGTPFDFKSPKPIGRNLKAVGGKPVGFDHNFAVDGTGLRRCARVVEPTTGRTLECWTTEPGVQFYSGNFLDGSAIGKGGLAYQQYAGFCLETQHYPNSANVPTFPNTILRPGERFRSTTEYRFGVE